MKSVHSVFSVYAVRSEQSLINWIYNIIGRVNQLGIIHLPRECVETSWGNIAINYSTAKIHGIPDLSLNAIKCQIGV